MKIDYKLRKTIQILSQNCRISTKELSKEIKTSQQNSSYYINKLFSERIILNSVLVIDPAKFGFNNYYVFVRLKHNSKNFLNQLFNELKKYKEITTIEKLFGYYDLRIKFTSNNASSFNKNIREIFGTYQKEILEYEILTQVVQHIYPRDYLSKKKFNKKILLSGDREIIKINQKEKEIINILNQNPRIPYSHIANEVNLTTKTVLEKIRKLEKNKIIKKYSIYFDHKKIGIKRELVLLKIEHIDQDIENKLKEFFNESNNVIEFTKTFGKWDAILFTEFFNSEDFKDFIYDLKGKFGDYISDYNFINSEEISFQRHVPILE